VKYKTTIKEIAPSPTGGAGDAPTSPKLGTKHQKENKRDH